MAAGLAYRSWSAGHKYFRASDVVLRASRFWVMGSALNENVQALGGQDAKHIYCHGP